MTNNENGTKSLSKRGFVERFFRVTPTKNAAFVLKLYEMVDDEKTADLIAWSETGDRFTIFDNIEFSSKVLPQYFKHCNWSSFVRQLNMYDFHKISDTNSSSSESNSGNSQQRWDFKHVWFNRQGHDRLHRIRRKATKNKYLANPVTSELLDNESSSSMQSTMDNSPPEYDRTILNTTESIRSFPVSTDQSNIDARQNDPNIPVQEIVTQLKYTIENMRFKLDSTSKEVLYLRQITATQQNLLNELLSSVDCLKSKLYDNTIVQETRKPRKIHELLGTNNEVSYDNNSFIHDLNSKRRKI